MKINKDAFNAIKFNDKTLEIRLCYGNRSKMKTNDEIIFINDLTKEKLSIRVSMVDKFDSLAALVKSIELKNLGKGRFKTKKSLVNKLKKMYGDKLNNHKILAIYLEK